MQCSSKVFECSTLFVYDNQGHTERIDRSSLVRLDVEYRKKSDPLKQIMDRESHRHGSDPRGVLQFRQNPQDAADHSGDGRWSIRSRLES